ncbi:MAG: hypothetical protein WCK88_08050 [bacterium]
MDDGDYVQIPIDPNNPIIPAAAPVLAPAEPEVTTNTKTTTL